MIHHSCDLCKREIEPEQDVRYVVKMEVYAALDPSLDETDDDRDGLAEVQEMLARMEEADGEELAEDDVYQQLRFDLCPECRKRFLKHPLGQWRSSSSTSARIETKPSLVTCRWSLENASGALQRTRDK